MARQSHKPAAADDALSRRADDSDRPWGEQHLDVVRSEIAAINTRRDQTRQIGEPEAGEVVEVVGLAQSGGGIRSSAVCLGVLQALNHHGLIERIDYLSTVSGGGYIGSSLSASMTVTGKFVFGEKPVEGAAERAGEISDTPAIGHIRNYSNYLIPAGARDLLTGMAIIVRGLVANLSLTLPVVLALAAITVASNPGRSCLYAANFFGIPVDGGSLGSLIPDSVSQLPVIGRLTLTFIAAAVALLLYLGGQIVFRLGSARRRTGRLVFVAYLAGTVLVMGLICDFARLLPVDHFGLTLAAALLGVVLFFIWALVRSFLPPGRLQEFRGHLPTMGATYLVLLAAIAFFEFQPFTIAGMFDSTEAASGQPGGPATGIAFGWIKSLAAITAPIATVVTVFRQQIADFLKSGISSGLMSRLFAVAAKAAIWLAGLALPLLIWVGYLYLCYWGIANDKLILPSYRECQQQISEPGWSAEAVQKAREKQKESAAGKAESASTPAQNAEPDGSTPVDLSQDRPKFHVLTAPRWLRAFAREAVLNQLGLPRRWAVVSAYVLVAVLLLVLSWLLKPNANSLHRLYRDRLSKAFLFDPTRRRDDRTTGKEPSIDQGRDFADLDDMKLSALFPEAGGRHRLIAPYHLINTALNIQGSDYANRRGRNADFFLFSPLHVGSAATGYAGTAEFEQAAPALDLATAMAISGAAVSSNMGSDSIKPLGPTLALLNVRLGYWLKNPRYMPRTPSNEPQHHSTPLYLWSEITGRLYENAEAVYLTDGGHIENLGVYELLRRRCKVIIAVDAEADASMNFSALMTLQRYARIDLGIRIDLPWTPIRTRTLDLMSGNAGKPPSPATSSLPAPAAEPVKPNGPHTAIGIIDYGGGEKGYLLYIKSSLSGDENDYIRDYARRNASFPHETTGDQFFSEEQFEVYRALGFHMTHEFLSGDDQAVAAVDGDTPVTTKFNVAGVASVDTVRAALGFPDLVPPHGDSASRESGLS
jgi:hypothetical protein